MDDKKKAISLSFKCDQDWDAMTISAGGRFCDTCQKKVYDFTDENTAYFIKIMHENDQRVCGRFNSDHVALLQSTTIPPWRKWAMAAMVFIGFNISAQKAKSQERIMGKVALNVAEQDCETYPVLGEVAAMPANPQLIQLRTYLSRKAILQTSINTNIVLSFSFNEKGDFIKLATGNKLPEHAKLKLLSILRIAPRWKTDQYQPNYPYSLWLTIKKGKVLPYFDTNH